MKSLSDLKKELFKMTSRRIREVWRPGAETSPPAVLRAASTLYEMGLRKDQEKLLARRKKLPVPVISIGNLSVGGTGKTPLTIWMCQFLLAIGLHPAVLTRGYGRKEKSPGRVEASREESLAELFGDEPVMMSEYLPETPVWVGSDRTASGEAALAGGNIDILVLDDGFQHLALDRDLDIVLLDCGNLFGNGLVLPAGPLREPPEHLKRADAFVLTHAGEGADPEPLIGSLKDLFPAIPAFACNHRLQGIRLGGGGPLLPPGDLSGKRAVVFAGIADPESFFDDMKKAGIEIVRSFDFPDHHRYTPEELLQVLRSATQGGSALILTTAKDSMRLPPLLRRLFAVAEIGIDFGRDDDNFRRFLQHRVSQTQPRQG
ncbi:MAG: tetraacyldisaccharide 4'-kinase [Syntrophobacteraceae bacterium]